MGVMALTSWLRVVALNIWCACACACASASACACAGAGAIAIARASARARARARANTANTHFSANVGRGCECLTAVVESHLYQSDQSARLSPVFVLFCFVFVVVGLLLVSFWIPHES
jgi:hypothetical protein